MQRWRSTRHAPGNEYRTVRLNFFLKDIKIDPPFEAKKPIKWTKWGIPEKSLYLTRDICKILNINPRLFYFRQKRGYYPNVGKRGRIRVFKEKEIDKILGITKRLKIQRNWIK